jgi:hypothetical protein
MAATKDAYHFEVPRESHLSRHLERLSVRLQLCAPSRSLSLPGHAMQELLADSAAGQETRTPGRVGLLCFISKLRCSFAQSWLNLVRLLYVPLRITASRRYSGCGMTFPKPDPSLARGLQDFWQSMTLGERYHANLRLAFGLPTSGSRRYKPSLTNRGTLQWASGVANSSFVKRPTTDEE